MDHKNGKWAKEILDSRNTEGMWGIFHTLSQPVKNKPITTEQTIRRLRILGFAKDDAPIQAVLVTAGRFNACSRKPFIRLLPHKTGRYLLHI